MAIYTVHEPPLKRYDTATDPERFVFVRDGFSWWAFLFAPLWMLRHWMWLVLVFYVALMVGVHVALQRLGLSRDLVFVIGALVGLLIGFESGTLRRSKLARRGWSNVGVIVGDDREMAEQRFFDAWVRSAPVAYPLSAAPTARTSSEVIGLFPRPGASR
jgi:Protein of unknown function (DUF2628)